MDQQNHNTEDDLGVRRFRRVVTGHDAHGRSVLLSDTLLAHGQPFMGIEGFVVTDLWKLLATPADNSPATADDPCGPPMKIAPPAGGVVFRTTQFPPESTWRPVDGEANSDDPPGPAAGQTNHPHMHRTSTLDFAIVIEGEIWAVMDQGETRLAAGDILIQRGTRHAWANRSTAPCVIAFVMIDARPLDP